MLRLSSFASLLAVPLFLSACQPGGASVKPSTDDQKMLYAIGLAIGQQTSNLNLKGDEVAYIIQGIRDSQPGRTPILDLKEYGPKLGTFQRSRQQGRTADERKAGEAVLAAAEKEQGAEKLPSGVIYKTEKDGTGESPKATDSVKVNYKGTLRDGKVFDSSYDRGQPATFGLTGVVQCWTQGIQKMKVGGKAKLTCPDTLAYGDRGHPPTIPGGAVLTFEVELLSIEPPGAAPTTGGPPGLSGRPGMPGMMGGHPMQLGGPGAPPGMHGMAPGAPPAPGAKPATPPAPTPPTTK